METVEVVRATCVERMAKMFCRMAAQGTEKF
jgi:hypothetical protein